MTATARPYAGRTPEERLADRRERLLDAALEHFGTRGYAATRIQDVCSAAGVTTRHFYEAFGDREALLRAVYDRAVEAHLAAVRASLAAAGDDDRLRAGVAAALCAWADDKRAARVAFVEVVGVSPAVERHRRAVIERYAGFVAEELAAAAPGDRDLTWSARALVAATIGVFEAWLAQEDPPPLDRLVDELAVLYAAPLTS